MNDYRKQVNTMAEIRRIPLEERSGMDSAAGRVPPQAVDIEAVVLGAMLLDKSAVSKVIEVLTDDAFYKDAHRKIFQAIITLFERSEPADIITVIEELRRRGELDLIGGEVYITELTMKVTSSANVEFHARIILEKALMRNLIQSSSEIVTRAFHDSEDAFSLLDDAEQKIFQISESRLKKSFLPMKEAIFKTMEMLESIHGKHSGVTGVSSGFAEIDDKTGGFQPSDLIIIAGRPSQGKTALALSIARNAAVDYKVPVGVFSLEMSSQQLVMRLICAEASVDAHKVRTGRLADEQWGRLSTRLGKLAEAKVFIDDTPGLGILEIRAKARRLKAEANVGLVIVDYLQLMQGPKNAQSREQEISSISRSLKALAKELNIPVIALSQLNRAVEARGDKRPVLSDLRESGSIEQDADVVMFVHRPEMFGINEQDGEPTKGLAEIIIGKQRNGPTGVCKLAFKQEWAGFENREFKHRMEPAYAPMTGPDAPETPF